jgi:hypothetical protein
VLPQIIMFVICCYKVLLPLLREPVTNLFEAGWFQNILGGGIVCLKYNPNSLNGISTAIGGAGAIFARILTAFFAYQTA